MAVDGSFRVELEFKRFLDRRPKLKSVQHFSNLLAKGDKITEEEVVKAVGELLLHPNYTIPLLGCLRPIAQNIVDRTVELLHLVPNLRSDDENYMEEFEEDKFLREDETVDSADVANVIDIYLRSGKGLRLHELACLAFSRALDLIPTLLGSILNYFKISPAPFERIMQCDSVSKELSMRANQWLNVIRASYLLLILEPEVFTTMWDWTCFWGFVQQSRNLTLEGAELRKNVSDMTWCSKGILSVVLRLSFKASEKLGPDDEEALQCLLRWKEFCMDVSMEKGGWYLESSSQETEDMVNTFPSSSAIFQEIRQPHHISSSELRNQGNPFFLTSTLTKGFERISLAVSQRWPVLLYGPAGAGKTALIHKLAYSYGKKVLSIHMDEQIDGKTLIGSYVCTDIPGEFRWQYGSLTQAVLNGFWVVFEDVDKAPSDVLSILLPLLDGATTFSVGHGEAKSVNAGFRLFSTVTSSSTDISRFAEGIGKSSLGGVWRKIMIDLPSRKDLLNILLQWYPELDKSLAEKIIETFEMVDKLTAQSSYSNRFTLRDLLKLCKRIDGLREEGLSSKRIYIEAVDVFASFSTSVGNRLMIMREIAKLWSISAPDSLYPVNKPIIQELVTKFQVGRVKLEHVEMAFKTDQRPFVELRSSAHTLERIACSVKFSEPVLLVGETGTGKTTLVQTLARKLGQKLTVLNLSQQSDVADLLGGFKPMDGRFVCIPLYKEFVSLFTLSFSAKKNEEFLVRLRKYLNDKNWKKLLSGFQIVLDKEIINKVTGHKRKRPCKELPNLWKDFSEKVKRAQAQVSASDGMIFSFIEGAFVTAMKNGEWILLDEVNLAPPEILQRVIGVLEDEKGSLCLAERGDIGYVFRHSNFRMFACMNPATDAGKRDLPFSLRSRFTEYFVDDVLDDEDLNLFIKKQLMDDYPSNGLYQDKIVQFYKAAKESEGGMQDGANQKPHYSLRSLYRALEYLNLRKGSFGFERSLYDGFCMFFQNLLDESSAKLMNNIICKYLLDGRLPSQLQANRNLISNLISEKDDYILTDSVKKHLYNLQRAVGRYPVLLQGHTSSGKTSLVRFLAKKNGREFVRINNHEHTDLQEYLGSYITDASGKLVFQEGALVKAVRNGQWIVLDELNLAPSDVLEALNRLLDDNREIFVPEIRETIRAHPDFMLFATQNPPVFYGGRKMLSRAFRNRFVEIHVDEIPQGELCTILEKKCKIPGSYAKKMINVMKELQLHRQSSKIFAGKHGFITPRDLFRWADRFSKFEGKSYEDLARDGYYLMAERLRDDAEKTVVKEVLERELRIQLSEDVLYKQEANGGEIDLKTEDFENIKKIIWTKSMQRMFFLVNRCYERREPVLLVGETGGGKTTICQLLSSILGSKLHILNCHQYTETSDFIGGFYPIRERLKISKDFQNICDKVITSKAFKHFPGDKNILTDINQASHSLHMLSIIIKSYREHSMPHHSEVTVNEVDFIEQLYQDLCQLQRKWRTIFTWQDGPLVEAMKQGDLFLVDEISLADDSVLERLNSVLEPERKLSLAEKGGPELETINAHPNFFLLATMNPGGDYGKKELSPALRNRFTEIWVPSANNLDELKTIALGIIKPKLTDIVGIILKFWEWFDGLETGRVLTIRDLLSWLSFINGMGESSPAEYALLHGACLVVLDGLTLGTNISKSYAAELREKCLSFLLKSLKEYNPSFDSSSLETQESCGWADPESFTVNSSDNMECDNLFGIHPFYIEKGSEQIDAEGFEFLAPTTRKNTLRVLRAMQLKKPVLLEGSPGVGKTSLIVALGRFSGHTVVRINLSEQTDIMDLLGSDLPVESDEGIQFAWSDGILLQALKKGFWILLDELNLAPQSVLEGLNAILDHRGEVFIPELGRSFKCPPSFRVFACQNPSHQGGGRKGLPKSFLNRFTKVYVDELVDDDYLSISSSLFPSIERSLLQKLIAFNKRLHQDTMLYQKFGQDGSPWEFNLRDVIRSCQIIQGASEKTKSACFLSTIYLQRMRTAADRIEVLKLYEQVFGVKPFINPHPRVQLNSHALVVGEIPIERYQYQAFEKSSNNLKILPGLRHNLEAVGQCVKNQWLCILVGPPSSGKTSLIRILAKLTGNVLNEINLSSTTDISELLGCFEQYNASRHCQVAIAQIEKFVNEYYNLQLECSPEALLRGEHLIARWLAFITKVNDGPSAASSSTYIDNVISSIPQLVGIIEYLKLDSDKQTLPVSWSHKDLDNILNMVRKLEEDHQNTQHSVKFEWVTGLMVKAIQNGEWIVLENANLCNPTVLDRINSLVEQSGSITINECGIVEGKPVVLHPHPKFRMFLTVNPSYGEVSRAMRNRGVEIYLMQPYWLRDEICGKDLEEIETRDAERFIALSGVPVGKLVDMMASAHIYAKNKGSHVGVTISYLDLSRWVQLFQQLITSGNRPTWSLQISWEHTYLSSFGEVIGNDIISQAAISYLSPHEIYKFTSSYDGSLWLPGGWPTPLKIWDYVCYSSETCVRQNSMYLESLGSQIIVKSTLKRVSKEQAQSSKMVHLMDYLLLDGVLFPRASNNISDDGAKNESEMLLSQMKLLFAADWVIEQATECDYVLYIRLFEWFGSRLQSCFSFFNLFLDILKTERQHSIWTKLLSLRPLNSMDKNSTFVPILSAEFKHVSPNVGLQTPPCTLLLNAIKCVTPLRHSLRQWRREDHSLREWSSREDPFITQSVKGILTCLRGLEEYVLDLLVESPSFDVLFELYNDLLEHHILFWKSITSSQIERRTVFWHFLMKDISKLKEICSTEVETFQNEMKNLDGLSSLFLNSSKSLMWKHGGHRILPSTADIYQKQCELSNFCEMMWPRVNKFSKIDENESNECTLDAALSSNVKLRLSTLEGVCMSPYIIKNNTDDDDSQMIENLKEIHQTLLILWEDEKKQLEEKLGTRPAIISSCCVFTPDTLCRKSGFEFWLKTQPINDETSLCFDLKLLQHLTKIAVVDIKEQHSDLSNISGLMESSLNFALSYSSRPLTDFVPHRNILWTIDAWASEDRANENENISTFIAEMWFKWHATLWEVGPILHKTLPEEDVGSGILFPQKLFQPLKLAVVDQILQSTNSIRDYPLHSFKLRVASSNIWHSSANMTRSHEILLSAARSLFQQIIYAHKKSFKDSKYAEIRSAFDSIQELSEPKEYMKILVLLVASSNHHNLTHLIDSYIEPLLSDLYPVCSPDDICHGIGCAFLRIGGLRYNLLISCGDLDPAAKYSIMYSELTEKIASLETEIKVREECAYLSGITHVRETDDCKKKLLQALNCERGRLRRKMVFRSNPGKFKELKHVCNEFLEYITASVKWIKNVRNMQGEQVIHQVHNWQEIMSRFIGRLSNEFSAYIDIIEPVQVAIYEMKLGLSLIVTSFTNKKYLANEEGNMEVVLETIYSLMRFPRSCASKTVSLKFGKQLQLSTCDIDLPISIEEVDMSMVQKMIGLTGSNVSDVMALTFKLDVFQNVLTQIKNSVADAQFLGNSTFKFLHEIFDEVASLWMKHRVKPTEESQYKFRTRAFNLESITEIDVSSCENLLAADSFSEWQKLLTEEVDEKIGMHEADEPLEQDWGCHESNLDDIVNIHNQLFGSVDLVQRPGRIKVSDEDRLLSFIGSYMLGVKLTRGLKGSSSSNFDAKISPEHLLRLCLEHDHKFKHPNKSLYSYNFYKDSNSPLMAQLVEPTEFLKQRILFLMKEWDDHPALQKILEVIEMVLALPLDTPLAKALSGVEFLLNRVRNLQETVAKFPLSDQMERIFTLVSSWHKLEFESWPALLDDVQSQFERNAAKLWFPLYAIFQRSPSADIAQYNKSTIESLEEFFKTSSIGEFRKRLQLLLSIHGHISNDMNRRSFNSPFVSDNVKVLYNTFGFYLQLLPRILEYIRSKRRSIEKELQDLLKLCRWGRVENFFDFEKIKKSRLKLKKIVKNYTDILQQPLMEFLGHEGSRSRIGTQTLPDTKLMVDPFEVSKAILDTVCNQTQSRDKDSSLWLADWWKRLEGVGDIIEGIKDCIPSQSSCLTYWEERKQTWDTIENLCSSLIHCGELWEDKSKMLGKRRAFSDLLKLLESCGLSKHRTSAEGQFHKSDSWLLQPSYEVQHLLLTQSDTSSGNVTVGHNDIQSSPPEVTWKNANIYYFKSIASTKYLEKICLNFHKDFTLEQVKRSSSYVDHLIEIQQGQRVVAYNFAKQLKCLRGCIWPLSNLFSSSTHLAREISEECSFVKNQHAIFKCMWQQKQLFDAFCVMMYEDHLLLETVEKNHSNTCSSVRQGAEAIHHFLKKVLLDFQNSKNLLDHHLLGSNEDITAVESPLHPCGVTREMEQLANQNFELIRTFKKNLSDFREREDEEGAVEYVLLGHFDDLFTKARIVEEFYSSIQTNSNIVDQNPGLEEEYINQIRSGFNIAFEGTYNHIFFTFKRLGSLINDFSFTGEFLKDINEWKVLFEKDIEHLQLDLICEGVIRTIESAGELLNFSANKNSSIFDSACTQLRHLYELLKMILAFGDNLLHDFLVIHDMVSTVTYVLANVFSSLFAKGFGIIQDEEDDNSKETTQDANGTGMGEGAGLNDVSDQISDEDQLLGNSEKLNEDQEAMTDQPSKTEKGIEMEQDFNGETLSVSEDSSDDEVNEGNQDEELESAMGEVGAESDKVDEKLGDKNDDENYDAKEKYEQGPSVKDGDSHDEELRPKEDSASANDGTAGDLDKKESCENNDEDGNEEDSDGAGDMNIDKTDSYTDPSGINIDEQNQIPDEDSEMAETEANEPMEDVEPEDVSDSDGKPEENGNLIDESLDERDSEHPAENAEQNNVEDENATERDVRMPRKDEIQQPTPNLDGDNNPTAQAAGLPKEESDTADIGNSARDEKYDFSDSKNDLSQNSDQPNAPQLEVRVPDSTNGKIVSNERSRTSAPHSESLIQKSQLNPCRSVGDAFDEWKQRVKVSVDLENQANSPDDMMDENADEYGFTAEFKDGTAQALGPATADQMKEGMPQNDIDRDVREDTDEKDATTETEIEKQATETGPIRNSSLNSLNDVKLQPELSDLVKQPEGSMEVDGDINHDSPIMSESLVSVNRSYMSEQIHQLSKFSVSDDEPGNANGFVPAGDTRDDAAAMWRRSELHTTRLSQELAEQLRLVMEPTLASKLQGDYKTGKRINMKKVIQYVASHYRKDKIWLRRTRPSKRDYQVVIAVDDSRSMSEGLCGTFAIEALVTVCRAMSQLEVGNFAVAKFGQQGNIKLLQDFDQPFTPEAGIKMISSLTFKQENTINDEPLAELLKYLNNMLDTAVMHSRLPSGYNPLEQLVLIIADGRILDKEKLKRRVRDFLSKKRMVAFLVLDSPNESIIDHLEYTFQGTDIKASKYLDTFPFPFYVVLKNIEALPRTLADLLRQWFELMQRD